ncbi:unnamed protein product [Ilex paraguariensis]|uniref:VQ domain-containing protein n=1 Tax=Ilex paraguariensis TaxID=185542 RepID=A0ABC8V289_9AQUA
MDMPDFSSGRSPRREIQLQGPRPAPLKVSKDSHKIRKPHLAPPQQPQPQAQHRPPVIIYTVSPKVIHAKPSEFMTLVQRLTGPSPDLSSSPATSSSYFQDNNGAISPAARFASTEKTKSPQGKRPQNGDVGMVEGIEISTEVEGTASFPGILSPNPSSLPTIPPNFFSPSSTDPNSLSFFYDLSPVLQGNRNYTEGSFMPSPSNFLSPNLTSPTPPLDFFNNFLDF